MNKRDKRRIKDAVLRILDHYDRQLRLPVPIKSIVKSFENVRLIPYSVQMRRRGITYQEMVDFTGTEDACTDYDASKNQYLIYYNDADRTRVTTNRYRWNIAHELGHIALEHHKQYKETRLFRNTIDEILYKKLEEEADMFAAYILVPHIVISCVANKNNIDIKALCKISDAASSYRTDDIKRWSRNSKSEKYDCDLLGYYSDYVEFNHFSKSVKAWLDEHRGCSRCKSTILSYSSFCPVCGNHYLGHYMLKREIMKYSNIPLDEAGRAIECPVCHNTEVPENGTYCVICGNSLINFCEAATQDPYSDCTNTEPLPGYARYCPFCGGQSTFLSRGILSPWDVPDSSDLPF